MNPVQHLASARALMGLSLAFHIIYAAIGVGIPLLLFVAEGLALKTRRPEYLVLARRWSNVAALLLAIGAVSGTILSFELGLLWPGFMRFAGGVVGMPFSLEGFAFFTEAIFLALYVFGWKMLSPFAHWLTAVPVMLGAAVSAAFVISANAWMNTPAGFRVENGQVVNVQVWQAMLNPAFPTEAIHGTLASYVATSFAVAGIYAIALLRGRSRDDDRRRDRNSCALRLALAVGAIVIPLQIITGDVSARFLAVHEPAKFAAMEALYATQRNAPITIGGLPDPGFSRTRFAIEIPGALSYLAYSDINAEVRGLDSFPRGETPDARFVHLPFDLMVGSGMILAAVAGLYWAGAVLAHFRPTARSQAPPWRTVQLVALASPLGFVALECGWLVTEFGRQPWVVHGILRTSAAVTPRPETGVLLVLFVLIYIALTGGLVMLLVRQARAASRPLALPNRPAEETPDDHA